MWRCRKSGTRTSSASLPLKRSLRRRVILREERSRPLLPLQLQLLHRHRLLNRWHANQWCSAMPQSLRAAPVANERVVCDCAGSQRCYGCETVVPSSTAKASVTPATCTALETARMSACRSSPLRQSRELPQATLNDRSNKIGQHKRHEAEQSIKAAICDKACQEIEKSQRNPGCCET